MLAFFFTLLFLSLVVIIVALVLDSGWTAVAGVALMFVGVIGSSIAGRATEPDDDIQACIDKGGRPVVMLNDDREPIRLEECR